MSAIAFDILKFALIAASGTLFIYVLLMPQRGTVWLKAEACEVLVKQGTDVQYLDDGTCAWSGKFDNHLSGLRLRIGKRFNVPYYQVITYGDQSR